MVQSGACAFILVVMGVSLLERLADAVKEALEQVAREQAVGKPFKFYLSLKVVFHRPTDPGVFTDPHPLLIRNML